MKNSSLIFSIIAVVSFSAFAQNPAQPAANNQAPSAPAAAATNAMPIGDAKAASAAISPEKTRMIKELLKISGYVDMINSGVDKAPLYIRRMTPAGMMVGPVDISKPEFWDGFNRDQGPGLAQIKDRVAGYLITMLNQTMTEQEITASLNFFKTPAGKKISSLGADEKIFKIQIQVVEAVRGLIKNQALDVAKRKK